MRNVNWVSKFIVALLVTSGCGSSGDSTDGTPTEGAGGSAGGGVGGAAGQGGAGTGGAAGQAGKAQGGTGGASGQGGKAQGGNAGTGGAGGASAGASGTAGGGAGGASGTGGAAGAGGAGMGGASGTTAGGAGGAGTGGTGGASGGGAGGAAGVGGSAAGASGQGGKGGAAPGLCCSTSNDPGCDGLTTDLLSEAQKAVQACVCAIDPSCCSDAWIDTCVLAIDANKCGPSCEVVQAPCQGDAECDDGVFCNGKESCTSGKCTKGTAPSCDDGVSCTDDFCDQAADSCKHSKSDAKCSDNNACTGVEICDPATGDKATGCVAGTPIVCDDGIACTTDACDAATGACTRSFDDSKCDNGLTCDGKETCTDTGCAQGTPETCDDQIDCTIDACDEKGQTCVHTPNNMACDDGMTCDGKETCNPATGDPKTGCAAGTAVPCLSDGVTCTVDACNEATGLCEHKADNTLCLAGQFCVPGQGSGCTAAKPCASDAQCDDGDACNGKETCKVVCQPGTPVSCDDKVDCTVDSCDSKTGACSHKTNNTACDNGLVCDGKETCDPVAGCVPGTPVVCDDSRSCTLDSCQEPTGTCVSTPLDVACDDGKLCNGKETCNPAKGNKTTGCVPGKPFVCPSDGIDCTVETCDTKLDACVVKEDDTKCACGQTCSAAKGGCGNFCVVQACSNGKVYACGDCKDNDGDCKIDSDDSQCLGPCDNTENAGPDQTTGCYFAPPPGQFNPKQKCGWYGPAAGDPYPTTHDATMTPVVINLTDDNGDGKIDTDDTPDIAFVSYADTASEVTHGVLRVLSGKCNADGTMKQAWVVGTSEIQAATGVAGLWFDFSGGLAAGDIDSDGIPDLVASLAGGGTIAISNQGKIKWLQKDLPKSPDYFNGGTPTIANLDAAGDPEIITGRVVLNGKDGTLRWKGTAGVGNNSAFGPVVAVADIDLDGKLNVLAGNTAYKHDGTVLWTYPRITQLSTTANCAASGGRCDGFTAVGNFDADDQAEVVIVSAGRVFILNHDGTPFQVNGANVEITLPSNGCTKNEGGPPTIADFDGDGQPEIGVAGANYYMVLDLECLATPLPAQCSDVGIRWKVANNDCSSRVTGSSVFDFDGDGNAEVIYNDEQFFRIFDGKTGTVLFQQANHSRTRLEMPIVADVDNDGKADVVFVENDSSTTGGTRHGLRVWGDANNTWVSTRRIWNQHAYHVTNVNEDGTVPVIEKPTWLEPTTSTAGGKMNNFRQNLPDYDALSAPDLTAALSFNTATCPGFNSATVKVCNQGLLKVSAGIAVALYDETTKAPIACTGGPAATKTDLKPGACENVVCQVTTLITDPLVRACVDNTGYDCATGGVASECHEDNNTSVVPAKNCPIQ